MFYETVCCLGEAICKICPGNKRTIGENWIRQSLRGDFREFTKKQAENHHREDRLNDCPASANCGLLIANLYVTPGEEIDELTVFPQFPKIKKSPAMCWSDANYWEFCQ